MRSDLSFIFSARDTIGITVTVETTSESAHTARKWLDDEWTYLGCEPLRPSGKVLLLDKILGVVDAYGYNALTADAEKAKALAQHIAHALGRPHITVDLPGLRVGY